MVTPYAPLRDGIAAYALQAVAALRAGGHEVEVLSPGPSAAHHHLDLRGPRGVLALAKRVRAYDRVVIQFHPDVFYPQPFADRAWAVTSYALAGVFRLARDLEVVVHETDYSRGRMPGPLGRAVRFMWQAAPAIVVHTEPERAAFHEAFGVPAERIRLTGHGEHFRRRVPDDRAAARQALGIPSDDFVFLSIGFIQPHKGFDRAIRAFGRLGGPAAAPRARLHVVGSLRLDAPEFVEHRDELEVLAAATPGTTLHVGYLSDEAFDRWIVAADVVVLPYRHIWSSGVMERAALYDRPVIVTRVGGLAGQARPGAVVVDGDDELADAMRAAAGLAAPPVRDRWPVVSGEPDREAVMAEVQSRAAALRGAARAATMATPARASAPLRRVPHLQRPAPTSARPGAGLLKRAQHRLTAWQLDPIIDHVNHLRDAAVEAADAIAAVEAADAIAAVEAAESRATGPRS